MNKKIWIFVFITSILSALTSFYTLMNMPYHLSIVPESELKVQGLLSGFIMISLVITIISFYIILYGDDKNEKRIL